jgi:hypothetical protein
MQLAADAVPQNWAIDHVGHEHPNDARGQREVRDESIISLVKKAAYSAFQAIKWPLYVLAGIGTAAVIFMGHRYPVLYWLGYPISPILAYLSMGVVVASWVAVLVVAAMAGLAFVIGTYMVALH